MIYEERNKDARARAIEYEIINGCWVCISHKKDKDEYPRATRNYKDVRLHRFVYEDYYNKKIEGNNSILHSCDNPSCINPNHLSEGSHIDNVRDMHKKGRATTAKITYDIANEIRRKYNNGMTQRELTLEYGLHNATISRIVNNKIWHREDW